MTSTPSSMLDGLTFGLDDTDERRRCVSCQQMRWDGEDIGRGECVCDPCMREVIECPNCEGWFKRAEFVTPSGVSQWCCDCDDAKAQWEMMRGVGP